MGIKYNGHSPSSARFTRTTFTASAVAPRLPLPEVRLLKLMEELDPALREVIRRALFDEPGRFARFAAAPASAHGHHSVREGALVHTIDVAECAMLLANRYEACVDKQTVLAAALLHDVGKCDEYTEMPTGWDMSLVGSMVGHKVIGCAIVWAALEPLRRTSRQRALAIMNAIAFASSRSTDLRGPATLEALIVSKADQLSAAADLFRQSLRASGHVFDGVRHRHLPEQPRHPCAVSMRIESGSPGSRPLTRAQRYPI